MFTRAFWNGALERAVRTFAQALLAVLGAVSIGDAAGPFNWEWNRVWMIVGTAGLAALLSLLTSIVAGVKSGNASFVPNSELTTTPGAVVDTDVTDHEGI